VQYLLQDVEVLAVGRRVVQEGEDQVQQTEQVLMTLALEPEDAERLVFAYNNGSLHFTLLPPESEDPDDPEPRAAGRDARAVVRHHLRGLTGAS
jgi:Flp pilus assembly protein CpaB